MTVDLSHIEWAAITAVLMALGAFLRPIWHWFSATQVSERSRLDAREERLIERERAYVAETERRLEKVEVGLEECEARELGMNAKFNRVLLIQERHRRANVLMTTKLREIAPDARELAEAHIILTAAYPFDPDLPADWQDLLYALDKVA
jgi:hypothetical protein